MKRSPRVDDRLVMDVIKGKIRALGLTQAEFAKRARIPLPTLRRWLAGKGISLASLSQLMSHLGLGWNELGVLMAHDESGHFLYTLAQENLFVSLSGSLALFERLRTGSSLASIIDLGISRHSVRHLTQALEVVGLIERHPGDVVKVLAKGEPRWRRGGPLARHFLDQGLQEFIGKCQQHGQDLRFGIHHLSADDAALVRAKLREVHDLISVMERKAKLSSYNAAKTHGLVIGFAPFRWRTLNEISEV